MAVERPAKQALRQQWLEQVRTVMGGATDKQCLYLTLPGALGRDIEVLAEDGIVRRTETGAIDERDQHLVVAIESNDAAILELQHRFPGLRVLQDDLRNLLHSDSMLAWPAKNIRNYFRALVINLDLNQCLDSVGPGDAPEFPVLRLIEKIAAIHDEGGTSEWTLCLTLHGEVHWAPTLSKRIQSFLHENISRSGEFAAACSAVLGADLFAQIVGDKALDIASLTQDDQQRVLLSLVPKRIVADHFRKWRINVALSCMYGHDEPAFAPMVSWIFTFTRSADGISEPDRTYRELVAQALANVSALSADGNFTRLVESAS